MRRERERERGREGVPEGEREGVCSCACFAGQMILRSAGDIFNTESHMKRLCNALRASLVGGRGIPCRERVAGHRRHTFYKATKGG